LVNVVVPSKITVELVVVNVSKLVNVTQRENKNLIDDEADIHSYQLNGLMKSNDNDNDEAESLGDEMVDADIQKKLAKFQQRRESRNPIDDVKVEDVNVNNVALPNTQIETHKQPKTKSKIKSKHVNTQQKSFGKRSLVVEEAKGDIGESFAELGGNNQDDERLNCIFANMEESPGC